MPFRVPWRRQESESDGSRTRVGARADGTDPGSVAPNPDGCEAAVAEACVLEGAEPICASLPNAPSTYFLHKTQQQKATTRSKWRHRDDELRPRFSGSGMTTTRSMSRARCGRSSAVREIGSPAARSSDCGRDGPEGRRAQTGLGHHHPRARGGRAAGRSRRPPVCGDATQSAGGRGLHLVLNALEQAIYERREAGLADLVHHSDGGTQ